MKIFFGFCIISVIITTGFIYLFSIDQESCVCHPCQQTTSISNLTKITETKSIKKSLKKPLRILWLMRYNWFVGEATRMDYNMMEILNELPNTISVPWGPYFPGYNRRISLIENIVKRFGSVTYFDVVIPNLHLRRPFCAQIAALKPYGIIIATIHHELRDVNTNTAHSIACAVDIVWFPYTHEIFHPQYQNLMERGTLFYYYPFIKLQSGGYCRGDTASKNRTIDVLLVGNTQRDAYPFRWKIEHTVMPILKQKGLNVYRRPYPTHRIYPGFKGPVNMTLVPMLESLVLKEQESYQQDYLRAKAVICTSSKFHYTLMKYIEAMSLGTFIFTDPLWDRMDEFEPFVENLNPNASPIDIASRIEIVLRNDTVRIAKARQLQRHICETYDHRYWRANIVRAIEMVRSKKYGAWVPKTFQTKDFRILNSLGYIPARNLMQVYDALKNNVEKGIELLYQMRNLNLEFHNFTTIKMWDEKFGPQTDGILHRVIQKLKNKTKIIAYAAGKRCRTINLYRSFIGRRMVGLY